MSSQQITGTITRKADGIIQFAPSDAASFSKLPAMGDEVTITVEVTRSAAEVEKAVAASKKERAAVAEAAPTKKK
jgi:hypothetical protein